MSDQNVRSVRYAFTDDGKNKLIFQLQDGRFMETPAFECVGDVGSACAHLSLCGWYRVRFSDSGNVMAIGHIFDDKWYAPWEVDNAQTLRDATKTFG